MRNVWCVVVLHRAEVVGRLVGEGEEEQSV